MPYTVLGIFSDRADAEGAIADLEEEGFRAKDLSIVMQDRAEGQALADDTGTNVAGSAAAGATTGLVIGGIAGLLGAIAIPGLGAFLIGGPIATALGLTGAAASTISGAATGVVAGGLLGALMGLGLPQEDAERYQEQIKQGGILLAVPTTDRSVDIAQDILDDNNAADVRAISVPNDGRRVRDNYDDDEITPEASNRESYATGAYAGAKGGRSERTGARFVDDDTEDVTPRRRHRRSR